MAQWPEQQKLDDRLFIACGLSWAAAVIHVKAALDHLDQSVLEAVLFEVTACAQILWGIAVYHGAGRRILVAGIAGNLAVAAAWVLSRTTGLPFGPTPWDPEPVGLIDVVATCDELALGVLVMLHLGGVRSRPLLSGLALMLVLVSSLLVIGPHVH